MGRRTLLLLAALIVAALGTTGVFLYVNGIDERAAASYDVVEVLVAKAPIPVGMSAQEANEAGALARRPFLRKSVEGLPALGPGDISGIASQVALADIAEGSPILKTQFGNRGDSSALPIPDGKVAVSVQLDDPARVAGFVAPGSEVAVFLTTDLGGGTGSQATQVLLERVQVIAAGTTTVVSATTGAGAEETLPKALLTLAVDQLEAQKIVYGSQNGQMHFALLTKNSKIDKSAAGTTAENLFD